MKTFVCNGHQMLSGVQYHHGDELPPGLLDDALLNYWLDHKLAIELDHTERRSLHRLFAPFSGCEQREALSQNELASFGLKE